jgi:hypothetical protein
MELIKAVKEGLIAHCGSWGEVAEAVRRFEPSTEFETDERKITISRVAQMDGVDGFWVVETNQLGSEQLIESDPALA